MFDEWRHTFNWQRPHEALGMKTPGSVYMPSTRAYDPSHVEIAYPPDWLERLVTSNGSIRLCSVQIHISLALAGFVVGLQPVADRLDVWFDYLRLGHIDLHVMRFIPFTENKKRRRSSSGRLAARRRSAGASGPPALDNQPPACYPCPDTAVLPMS